MFLILRSREEKVTISPLLLTNILFNIFSGLEHSRNIIGKVIVKPEYNHFIIS